MKLKNLSETRRIHWTVRLKETNKKAQSLYKNNFTPLDTWDKGKKINYSLKMRKRMREYDYKILRNDVNRII